MAPQNQQQSCWRPPDHGCFRKRGRLTTLPLTEAGREQLRAKAAELGVSVPRLVGNGQEMTADPDPGSPIRPDRADEIAGADPSVPASRPLAAFRDASSEPRHEFARSAKRRRQNVRYPNG